MRTKSRWANASKESPHFGSNSYGVIARVPGVQAELIRRHHQRSVRRSHWRAGTHALCQRRCAVTASGCTLRWTRSQSVRRPTKESPVIWMTGLHAAPARSDMPYNHEPVPAADARKLLFPERLSMKGSIYFDFQHHDTSERPNQLASLRTATAPHMQLSTAGGRGCRRQWAGPDGGGARHGARHCWEGPGEPHRHPALRLHDAATHQPERARRQYPGVPPSPWVDEPVSTHPNSRLCHCVHPNARCEEPNAARPRCLFVFCSICIALCCMNCPAP